MLCLFELLGVYKFIMANIKVIVYREFMVSDKNFHLSYQLNTSSLMRIF